MNTITICIRNIVGGDSSPIVYGKADEIRNKIRDFRGILPYNESNVPILTLSLAKSNNSKGAIYTIIKNANGGRTQDYLSCSLFVPAEIDVTGDEMAEILKKAETILSEDGINNNAIKDITSKMYPLRKAIPQFTLSANDATFAVRYFGVGTDYSLQDIVGSPFQSYYSKYEYILLVDLNNKVSYSSAQYDFTQKPIISFVVLEPISDPNGFIPYIGGMPFKQPISVQEGTTQNITWIHEGYAEINLPFRVQNGMQIPVPKRSDMSYVININSIKVYDITHHMLAFKLDVNPRYCSKNSQSELIIPVTEYNSVDAVISADGYKSQKVYLKDVVNKNPVLLEESHYVYKIELSFPGSKIKFRGKVESQYPLAISSFNLPSNIHFLNNKLREGESEINKAEWVNYRMPKTPDNSGTYVSGKGKRGSEVSKTKSRNGHLRRFVVFIVFIAVIVLFTGLVWPGWMSKKSPKVDTTDTTTYVDTVNTRAIEYLDTHKAWKKDALQEFQLEQLYDDMVNFRFENLANPDLYNLSSSKEYLKLVEAVKEAQSKGIVAPNGKLYSANGDSITIDKYIKYIKNKANFVPESHPEEQEEPDFGLNDASSTEPSTDNHQSQSSTLSENKNNRTNNSSRSNTSNSKRSQNSQNQDASINGAGR